MRNRNALTAALAVGFLLLSAGAQEAAAQTTIPLGSYKQTCSGIKVQETTLGANCKAKEQSTIEKILPGGAPFTPGSTYLVSFHECEGDIWNDNGYLKCNRNPNRPKLQQARAAIDDASLQVFGRKGVGHGAGDDHAFWLGQMFNAGMLGNFYAGLTPNAVAGFYGKMLGKPDAGQLRATIIERAHFQATGAPPDAARFAFWDAKLQQQQATFQTILSTETLRVNAKPSDRRLMLQVAYVMAFGRMPNDGDLNYWQPRGDNFKQVVEANRNWLYSPNGAQDLATAVALALQARLNRKPTDQEVKNALGDYKANRQVFMEMRGAMPANYY